MLLFKQWSITLGTSYHEITKYLRKHCSSCISFDVSIVELFCFDNKIVDDKEPMGKTTNIDFVVETKFVYLPSFIGPIGLYLTSPIQGSVWTLS